MPELPPPPEMDEAAKAQLRVHLEELQPPPSLSNRTPVIGVVLGLLIALAVGVSMAIVLTTTHQTCREGVPGLNGQCVAGASLEVIDGVATCQCPEVE